MLLFTSLSCSPVCWTRRAWSTCWGLGTFPTSLICGLLVSFFHVKKSSTDDDENDEEKFNEVVETWVEWIRRATFTAEEYSRKAGIDDWVVAQRRRKFWWAGHVARRMDGRWSSIVVNWTPGIGSRRVVRPAMRWADTLVQYFSYLGIGNEAWLYAVQDRGALKHYEEEFCNRGR